MHHSGQHQCFSICRPDQEPCVHTYIISAPRHCPIQKLTPAEPAMPGWGLHGPCHHGRPSHRSFSKFSKQCALETLGLYGDYHKEILQATCQGLFWSTSEPPMRALDLLRPPATDGNTAGSVRLSLLLVTVTTRQRIRAILSVLCSCYQRKLKWWKGMEAIV